MDNLSKILEFEETLKNRNRDEISISYSHLGEIKDNIELCLSQLGLEEENEDYRIRLSELKRRVDNMMNTQTVVRKSIFEKDEPEEELFECKICFDNFNFGDMESLDCGHLYCTPCLYTYYKSKIIEADVLNITCPDPTCDQTASSFDVQKIVDDRLFEKYQRFERLATLKADENVRWCPKEGCENAVIGDPNSPTHPRLDCNICGTSFCYDCRQRWHQGLTCQQAMKQSEDDKTRKWKKKNHVKLCPNCGIQILKNRGCSEVTCTNCKIKFDWKTGDTNYQDLETSVDLIFTFPRRLYEASTSQELAEIFEKKSDQTKAQHTMKTIAAGTMLGVLAVTATTIWIPVFVVAGPPIIIYKTGKKIKKKFKNSKHTPKQPPKRTKTFINFSTDLSNVDNNNNSIVINNDNNVDNEKEEEDNDNNNNNIS